MRVLITGATGYLGRTLVQALAARGPRDGGLLAPRVRAAAWPGDLVDGDVRDAAAVSRAAAGLRRHLPHGGGRGRLAQRAATTSTRSTSTACSTCCAPPAAPRHRRDSSIPRRSSPCRPPAPRAPGRGTTTSGPRSPPTGSRRRRRAEGAPVDHACIQACVYGPGPLTEGNLVGRMLADYLAGRLPGLVGADARVVVRVDRRRGRGRTWRRSNADAPGARYQLGGENAPQLRAVRDRARADRAAAAAPTARAAGRAHRRRGGIARLDDRAAAVVDGRHGRNPRRATGRSTAARPCRSSAIA